MYNLGRCTVCSRFYALRQPPSPIAAYLTAHPSSLPQHHSQPHLFCYSKLLLFASLDVLCVHVFTQRQVNNLEAPRYINCCWAHVSTIQRIPLSACAISPPTITICLTKIAITILKSGRPSDDIVQSQRRAPAARIDRPRAPSPRLSTLKRVTS